MRARTLPLATLLLGVALGAAAPAAARAAAPLLGELMGTRVVAAATLRAEPTQGGTVRRYFDAPTSTLLQLGLRARTLDPGAVPHPTVPYTQPTEQVLVVREGVLELKLDEKKPAQRLDAGSAVFLQPHQWHALRNPGPQPATYYELEWTSPGMSGERQF